MVAEGMLAAATPQNYGTGQSAAVVLAEEPRDEVPSSRRVVVVVALLLAVAAVAGAAGARRGALSLTSARDTTDVAYNDNGVPIDGQHLEYSFVGCFEVPVDVDMGTVGMSEDYMACEEDARIHDRQFFVMTEPILGSAEGKAKCGFAGSGGYVPFSKWVGGKGYDASVGGGAPEITALKADPNPDGSSKCGGGDTPLGGAGYMAVYEKSTYLEGLTGAWSIFGGWDNLGWGECQPGCGDSKMTRRVVCVRSDGVVVDEPFCDIDKKPSDEKMCSDHSACGFFWEFSDWGKCQPACGVSTMYRQARCVEGTQQGKYMPLVIDETTVMCDTGAYYKKARKLSYSDAVDAEGCQADCAATMDIKCEFWQWKDGQCELLTTDGSDYQDGGLQPADDPQTECGSRTCSFPMCESGKKYTDGTLISANAGGDTAADCRRKCRDDAACLFWSWDDEKCSMFSDDGSEEYSGSWDYNDGSMDVDAGAEGGSQSCAFPTCMQDMVFAGGDSDIAEHADNAFECRRACREKHSCTSWDWIPDDGDNDQSGDTRLDGTCRLHKRLTDEVKLQEKDGAEAGASACSFIGCQKRGWYKHATELDGNNDDRSPTECRNLCVATSNCEFWDTGYSGWGCRLLANDGGGAVAAGSNSAKFGSKYCGFEDHGNTHSVLRASPQSQPFGLTFSADSLGGQECFKPENRRDASGRRVAFNGDHLDAGEYSLECISAETCHTMYMYPYVNYEEEVCTEPCGCATHRFNATCETVIDVPYYHGRDSYLHFYDGHAGFTVDSSDTAQSSEDRAAERAIEEQLQTASALQSYTEYIQYLQDEYEMRKTSRENAQTDLAKWRADHETRLAHINDAVETQQENDYYSQGEYNRWIDFQQTVAVETDAYYAYAFAANFYGRATEQMTLTVDWYTPQCMDFHENNFMVEECCLFEDQCTTYWDTTDWGPGCDNVSCEEDAVRTRSATCLDGTGQPVDPELCLAHTPEPELEEDCDAQAAQACTYHWIPEDDSGWDDCVADCGDSYQEREVACVYDIDETRTVDDSKCEAEDRPDTQRECESMETCEFEWEDWEDWDDQTCSTECGYGWLTRPMPKCTVFTTGKYTGLSTDDMKWCDPSNTFRPTGMSNEKFTDEDCRVATCCHLSDYVSEEVGESTCYEYGQEYSPLDDLGDTFTPAYPDQHCVDSDTNALDLMADEAWMGSMSAAACQQACKAQKKKWFVQRKSDSNCKCAASCGAGTRMVPDADFDVYSTKYPAPNVPTDEGSVEECQLRCAQTADCAVFTRDVEGKCHLASGAAVLRSAASGTVSGPGSCMTAESGGFCGCSPDIEYCMMTYCLGFEDTYKGRESSEAACNSKNPFGNYAYQNWVNRRDELQDQLDEISAQLTSAAPQDMMALLPKLSEKSVELNKHLESPPPVQSFCAWVPGEDFPMSDFGYRRRRLTETAEATTAVSTTAAVDEAAAVDYGECGCKHGNFHGNGWFGTTCKNGGHWSGWRYKNYWEGGFVHHCKTWGANDRHKCEHGNRNIFGNTFCSWRSGPPPPPKTCDGFSLDPKDATYDTHEMGSSTYANGIASAANTIGTKIRFRCDYNKRITVTYHCDDDGFFDAEWNRHGVDKCPDQHSLCVAGGSQAVGDRVDFKFPAIVDPETGVDFTTVLRELTYDPEKQQPCEDTQGCSYRWETTDFNKDECVADCGPSVMPRTVTCVRADVEYIDSNDAQGTGGDQLQLGEQTQSDAVCHANGLKSVDKPEAESDVGACFSTDTCSYSLEVEDWSGCEPACGASKMTRTVKCTRSDTTEVDLSFCQNGMAIGSLADSADFMTGIGDVADRHIHTTRVCEDFTACSYAWHIGADIPTCRNDVQDADEDGVDCGGDCPPCAVDGGWSAYGQWSQCSEKCGPGVITSKRTCTNPKPKAGGKNCEGQAEQTKSCPNNPECEMDVGEQCDVLPLNTLSSFQIDLVPGPATKLVELPVGKANFFVRVSTDFGNDIDIGLTDQGGDALISYSAPLRWGDSSWDEGLMKIQGCTDDCSKDLTVEFHDGTSYTITGDGNPNSEWVYVDRIYNVMHITVKAYAHGKAKVEFGYDCIPAVCPGQCHVVQQATGKDALKVSTAAGTVRCAPDNIGETGMHQGALRHIDDCINMGSTDYVFERNGNNVQDLFPGCCWDTSVTVGGSWTKAPQRD